jgi:hypothetical protein
MIIINCDGPVNIEQSLHGKYLMIDKSLYGLKTSAARFHEHLSELIPRLGFKDDRHEPDLWMVEKSSDYEYVATYVDDIFFWSKDSIKSYAFIPYCFR